MSHGWRICFYKFCPLMFIEIATFRKFCPTSYLVFHLGDFIQVQLYSKGLCHGGFGFSYLIILDPTRPSTPLKSVRNLSMCKI